MTRTCLALVALLVACGPKSGAGSGPGGGGGQMPAAVSSYAGLRWVPADATYAAATRRTEDVVTLGRHFFDAVGILGEFDAADVSREASRELIINPLSADALAEIGIDLQRGTALWSRGLGPNIAVPLADPQRFAAELETRRGSAGIVTQVTRAHDVDVYTFRPDGDAAVHWAVVGDWFLAHVEIMEEREADGAWFEAAWNAGGGLAGHADFAAALDEAGRRVGADPPMVGLVRVPSLLQHPLIAPALTVEARGCAPIANALGRIFFAGAATDRDARGAVVAEVGPAIDRIRAIALPVPGGWTAARANAPVQVDVGVDLHVIAAVLQPCTGDDLVRETDLQDVRGGRAFAHEVDVPRMTGKGSLVVETVDPRFVQRVVDDAIGDIPGIGFLTKKKKVGALAVTVIDVPSFPAVTYGTSGTTGFASVGGGIEAVLAGGIVAGGDELAHLSVAPRAWPAATWDAALAPMVRRDDARADLIRRLREWSLGEISVTAEGRALVLTAHGAR